MPPHDYVIMGVVHQGDSDKSQMVDFAPFDYGVVVRLSNRESGTYYQQVIPWEQWFTIVAFVNGDDEEKPADAGT